MQVILDLLSPDLLANYVAIAAIVWTAAVIGRRWRRDNDPLTGSLFFAFLMQSIGLVSSVMSEFHARIIVDIPLRDIFSIVFILTFIISFVPIANFYTGLFIPRNKWYLPFVSFVGGAGASLAVISGAYYNPPMEVYGFLVLLILFVYLPLSVSCVRLAPLANRRVTGMKFRLVGLSAFIYVLPYLVVIVPEMISAPPWLLSLTYALAGLFLSVSYVLTYLGWVMPSWLRNRFAESSGKEQDTVTARDDPQEA